MKKENLFPILIVFSLLLSFSILFNSSSLAEETAKIVILHTNDIHGFMFPYIDDKISPEKEIGGFQYLSTLIKNERAKNPGKVLLLDGGDIVQGTIYSNLSGGIPLIELMNDLKYDATVTGNHEFDWSARKLEHLIEIADFPVLVANVIRKSDGGFLNGSTPYTLKNVNGVKIGIIGVTFPDTSIIGQEFEADEYDFLSPEETLKMYVPVLKNIHKVDLVVILSHLGVKYDQKIAEEIPEIDIIVGSHSHTTLVEPILIGDTIIIQAKSYMVYLGRLEIDFDVETKEIVSYEGKLLSINEEIIPDPEVEWALNNFLDKFKEYAERVIGVTEVNLDRYIDRETNFGNLFADSMIEAGKTDIALINNIAIRVPVPQGEFTMEKLYEVYPYDNILTTMDLTGQDIKDILEWAIIYKYGLLNVSGMTVRYDLSQPDGQKAVEIIIRDKPIDLKGTYSVSVPDFLAMGGNEYYMFKNGKNLKKVITIRNAVEKYLEMNSPVNPRVEGRIIIDE